MKDSNQSSEPITISITQSDLERPDCSLTCPRVETKKLRLAVGARPRRLRHVAHLLLFHLLSAPQWRRQWDKKDAADGGGVINIHESDRSRRSQAYQPSADPLIRIRRWSTSRRKVRSVSCISNPENSSWNTRDDRNQLSRRVAGHWGMFTVRVNYRRTCTRSSKRGRDCQGSLCSCGAPVQMFREREEVERQILVYWKAPRGGLWVQQHQQYDTEQKNSFRR